MFQILEIRENIVDKELSVEHTPQGKKAYILFQNGPRGNKTVIAG